MMTGVVKIPDPIYEKASEQAEQEDATLGTIIREWSQKADAYDSQLIKTNVQFDRMDELRALVDDLHVQAQTAQIANNIPDEYAQMQKELADELSQFVDDEQATED